MESKIDEILKTSEELFMRNGIKSVSMDDIASSIGISKKTLYKYFDDKTKLVKLTFEAIVKRHRFLSQNCPKAANAIEEYYLVYKTVTEMIKQANFSVENDLKKYYPPIYKLMLSLRRKKMEESLRTNLKRGIEEGLYRSDLDIETILLINVRFSESLHDFDFLNENRDQLIHIMLVGFDYHIRGIVNEKGLNEYMKLKNQNEKIDL